jgi:hypothetical protein
MQADEQDVRHLAAKGLQIPPLRLKVSDGTRTRDRLDHNQRARIPDGRANPASQAVSASIGPYPASCRYGSITDGFRPFRAQPSTVGPTIRRARSCRERRSPGA